MEGNCADQSELELPVWMALAACRGFSRGDGLALGEAAKLGAPHVITCVG